MLIGMIRSQGRPGPMATAMALAARAQGADLVFFRPRDVDLERRLIQGQRWDGTGWVAVESRFPDVIENDDTSPGQRAVWRALTADAPFTTHRLGGKLAVFGRIAGHPAFADLLIPQERPETDADLAAGLDRHGTVILKPVFGSQGRDVWRLRREGAGVHAQPSTAEAGTIRPLEGLMRAIAGGKPYLLQRCIDATLPGGNPFDIRLHVRRDHRADWRRIKIYARIGLPGRVTSNLATGGSIGEAAPLLRHRHGAGHAAVLAHLEDLARRLPEAVQSLYPDTMLDALGIDLGLDADGRPWLFEINSFPGAKYFEVADAVPRIGYCLALARRGKRG